MSTEIKRYANASQLAQAAADQFIEIGTHAINSRGYFAVALSGGSTPKRLFQLLAEPPHKTAIDWQKVFVFWGDERSVGPEHPESNYGMAYEFLLGQIPIPAANVFRMKGEEEPAQAAADYKAAIRQFFSARQTDNPTQPRFDLIHLGMGDDGHTLSLFPESEAVYAAVAGTVEQGVVANYVAKFDTWRITLTTKIANNAAHVSFLVGGANKASVLKEVLQGPYDPTRLPSQLINPASGQLIWMLDEDAASKL